jgi:hypothetical protein
VLDSLNPLTKWRRKKIPPRRKCAVCVEMRQEGRTGDKEVDKEDVKYGPHHDEDDVGGMCSHVIDIILPQRLQPSSPQPLKSGPREAYMYQPRCRGAPAALIASLDFCMIPFH